MIFSEIERPGSYLLDIHTRDTVFAPYRVDVESDGRITGIWETFRGSPWEDRGGLVAGNNGEKDALIEPKVLGRRNFYEERPGCMVSMVSRPNSVTKSHNGIHVTHED